MLRLALQPRWLGLLALALLLATACALLGNWQLSRAQQDAPPDQIPAAQPLTAVLDPQTELDGAAARTPVVVQGVVDTSQPVMLVTGRVLDGAAVRWVVVPVLVDGGPARLPVVLGVIDDGEPAPHVSAEPVRFEAFLQAGDGPQPATGDDTMGSVDLTQLLNRWGAPMYAAYVFSDQPTADAVTSGVHALPAQPPAPSGSRFAILNLSYALQWWVFAAFAVFIWWRMLRDGYLKEQQDLAAERLVP